MEGPFLTILNRFFFQIAHMTKSEMGYADYGYFGPLLLFLNQYFNNFLPEIYVLYIALIWCTYDLLVYCSQVSITNFIRSVVELSRIFDNRFYSLFLSLPRTLRFA